MKNLFLLKNIKNFFSFGKDSFYNFYKCFFKKKVKIFMNYSNFDLKYFNLIKKINLKIFYNKIKKYSKNELLLRKIRFFSFKNKNLIFIKNHHKIDKIEFLIIKILKKKNIFNTINNWIYKKNYSIKPFINNLIKKYININDKTNKFIRLNRNFLRCLLSNCLIN